jgi:hypothetical protein
MPHTGRGATTHIRVQRQGLWKSCQDREEDLMPSDLRSVQPTGGTGAPNVRSRRGIAQREWSVHARTSPGSEASRGETQPFQGHRHARCAPGKAGSPAEITASTDHRRSRKTLQRRSARLRPGRTVSDILECGGAPHHSGEERRSKDESVRTRPCVFGG